MAGRMWRGALQLGKQMKNIHREAPMTQMVRTLSTASSGKLDYIRPGYEFKHSPFWICQLGEQMKTIHRETPMRQMVRTLSTTSAGKLDYIRPGYDFKHPPFGPAYGCDVEVGEDGLPVKVDWSLVPGAVSEAQDQGDSDLCYSFSSLASAGSINFIMTGEASVPLSVQQVLDCNTLSGSSAAVGGHPYDVLNFVIKSGGVLPASVYPFTGVKGICKRVKGVGVTIDDWKFVRPNSEAALKYAVAYQPVIVSICVEKIVKIGNTIVPFHSYPGGIIDGPSYIHLDHCALLVGYGETDEGMLFWKLLNNLGISWGADGFFYVKRNGKWNKHQQGGALGILREPLVPLKKTRRGKRIVVSKCESCGRCFK